MSATPIFCRQPVAQEDSLQPRLVLGTPPIAQATVPVMTQGGRGGRGSTLVLGGRGPVHKAITSLPPAHVFAPPTIAELFGSDPSTVRRWIGRFNREGIAGPSDRPRSGRPRLGSPGSKRAFVVGRPSPGPGRVPIGTSSDGVPGGGAAAAHALAGAWPGVVMVGTRPALAGPAQPPPAGSRGGTIPHESRLR